MTLSRFTTPLITALLILAPSLALAADKEPTGSEGTFIGQVVVLLVVGRLLGEGMVRLGQPAIMGQLLAGIVLGPTVFGQIAPHLQKMVFPDTAAQKAMINALSQFGILLLLLLTGMETDLKLVKRVGKSSVAVALCGVAVPFACGFGLGWVLPDSLAEPKNGSHLVPALFLGTALSISSVKIVATVVREMNFMRRDLGQMIVSSAIMEDTIGWVIIAATTGLATHGSLNAPDLAKTLGGVAVFMIASFTIGRWVVFRLIRWANDSFRSDFPVISMILIIMGGMAVITNLLGVNTVLGAFVAGILVGDSPILTKHIEEQLRGLVAALFMPVFFGLAGLSADLRILADPKMLGLTVVLILIASVGKFGGAFTGGMLTGLKGSQAMALGSAMNARGSTEVIVATIGLSMGALTQNLYSMIVTMAVLTTTAMPPMLRKALSRLPMDENEKARIEREELDERGFVSNLERLLLAVDESPIGRFTSRIAGVIAGSRGMPTTILARKDTHNEREVQQAAKAAASTLENSDEKPGKVAITARSKADARKSEAVAEEAEKGYSLLAIGLADSHDYDPEHGFNPEIEEIAAGFEGPLLLAAAAEGVRPPVIGRRSRILVPVNGTEVSRRAVEVALALARPSGATVIALFASTNRKQDAPAVSRQTEEAVLKEIAQLGERYEAKLRTVIRPEPNPDRAILAAAERCELIVMGVSRRPGEALLFGNTANAVLHNWKGVTLFVAS